MRIMGLDYGSKTVGVAVSDPLGITAQAVETIWRKDENKLRKTCAHIEELIREYEDLMIGRTVEVLMEEEITLDGEVWQVGHTREYVKIGRKYEENLTNQLINVEIQNRLQIID